MGSRQARQRLGTEGVKTWKVEGVKAWGSRGGGQSLGVGRGGLSLGEQRRRSEPGGEQRRRPEPEGQRKSLESLCILCHLRQGGDSKCCQ